LILAVHCLVHRIVSVAAFLILGAATPGQATSSEQEARTASSSTASGARLARYQVAAGTALLLKLRTPLDSATASVNDQVDAELWSPVIQDGVELIPVGSVAMGKVVSVVRASEREPIGTLTFIFTIIEHAGTGDRAMLTTRIVVIEAPREPRSTKGRGKDRLKVAQVVMRIGTPLVAMTAEPLVVRIPR